MKLWQVITWSRAWVIFFVWKWYTAALIVTLMLALFGAISLSFSALMWSLAGFALLTGIFILVFFYCSVTHDGMAISAEEMEEEDKFFEEQKKKALNEPKLNEPDANARLDQILDEERKRRENE